MPAPGGHRPVHFRTRGWIETATYRRDALPAGCEILGPVIVEEPDSTTLVPPGFRLRATPEGLLRLAPAGRGRAAPRGASSTPSP